MFFIKKSHEFGMNTIYKDIQQQGFVEIMLLIDSVKAF